MITLAMCIDIYSIFMLWQCLQDIAKLGVVVLTLSENVNLIEFSGPMHLYLFRCVFVQLVSESIILLCWIKQVQWLVD